MKAILTLIFVILIGSSAVAQANQKEVKVSAFTAGVELNIKITKTNTQEGQVARLYKFKNSRIKKALNFRTKRNNSKIA